MKLVLLTNILSPYRKVFYDCIDRQCKQKGHSFNVLLMNNTESNRNWNYEEYSASYTELLEKHTYLGLEDSLYTSPNITKRLAELNPDALILAGSYTFLPNWQALKWAKRNPSCLLLFWSESHLDELRNYNIIKLSIREAVRKYFYSKMNGFWYPGKKAKELIQKYANPNAFYIHIPNLIDNKLYQGIANNDISQSELRAKYNLPQEFILFFSPIRLQYVKGMSQFLDLIRNINYKEKFAIVIAGEGELKEEIEEKAASYGINVIMLGYRITEEIAELYKACDIVLLPSLSDPSPLTCIEALWSGKPLFVSRHVGNYPEVIIPEKNGYVFNYEEKEAATQIFETILIKGNNFIKAAQESSTKQAQFFDLENRTEMLLTEMERHYTHS